MTAPSVTTSPRPAGPSPRFSLILLLSLNLLTYLDRQILASVESRISAELLPGDANAQGKMGLLATLFLVSYMVFSPIFGHLGDRYSRWTLVGLGTIVGSIATGWTGLAYSFGAVVAARCLVGISEAAYAPVAPTLLSDLYPIQKRGQILAWFYAAIPVGAALGYVTGGVLADTLGWRWAFLALLPPGILAGLIPLFLKDPRAAKAARMSDVKGKENPSSPANAANELPHPTSPSPPPQNPKSQVPNPKSLSPNPYLRLLRIPSFFYCCAGMTAMTFALGGISFWMPRFIHQTKDYSTLGTVNLILGGIVVITGLAATLAGGFLGDRLRARIPGSYFLVSGVGLLLGFPLFLLVLYLPFPLAWIPLGGAVFFLFFNTGPANTILANVTPPPIRATAFALNIFIIHALGDAISPPLIGFIADRASLTLALFLVAFMFLLGGLLWLLGTKHLAADTERVSAEYPDTAGNPALPPL